MQAGKENKFHFFNLFKQLVSHDEDVSHDGDGERQEEAVKPDEVVEEDHDEAAAEDADVFHHRKQEHFCRHVQLLVEIINCIHKTKQFNNLLMSYNVVSKRIFIMIKELKFR